jgi:predicted enzyme related to lactoylglutathione lyase
MNGSGLNSIPDWLIRLRWFRHWAWIASLAGLLGGCAVVSEQPVIPSLPIDSAATYDGPRFVWYDLFTHDVEGASSFYHDLFGWDFESTPEYGNFFLAHQNGVPVAGLVRIDKARAETIPPQWVPNLLVGNLEEAAGYFSEAGRVLKGPVDLPDRGRIAVVEDAEGAPLILLQTTGGLPAGAHGVAGRFLWTELWSMDVDVSMPFYKASVGFVQVEGPAGLDPEYRILGTGDRRLAGLIKIPFDNVHPLWLSYIAVANPTEVARRAVSLGGRVIIGPDDTNDRMAAVIADPIGGVFGVQKWPIAGLEEKQP